MGVGADLTLGVWVGSEEALVVELPDACAATNWLRLLHLGHLWSVAADLACLREGAMNLAHLKNEVLLRAA